MALSPAKRHFLQATAAQEAAAVAPEAMMEGATGYEMMLAKLQQDQFRLKQVQSTEGKALLKATLLPDYIPYVDGVLAAGNGAQDDVLVRVMLWRLDASDFEGGLTIAAYVLEHNLKMLDGFKRTTGCVVAEQTAEAALNAIKAGGTFDLGTLALADRLTASHDMPDEARAKLMLAISKLLGAMIDDATPKDGDTQCLEAARHFLSRAIELYDKCGGKKDMERLERLLKKHAGTTG